MKNKAWGWILLGWLLAYAMQMSYLLGDVRRGIRRFSSRCKHLYIKVLCC